MNAQPPMSPRIQQAWQVLEGVPDPEVPAVSLCDLGIVRAVLDHGDRLEVVLTPTYSGCPATEVIQNDVLAALAQAHLGPASITMQLAPAWTTDWISAAGHEKMRAYGIAPPGPAIAPGAAVPLRFMAKPQQLACPRCDSILTEQLSAFGSTACKSLYRCRSCGEPFEHFKPI